MRNKKIKKFAELVEAYLLEHVSDNNIFFDKGLTAKTKKIINKEWLRLLEKNEFSQDKAGEMMDYAAKILAYYFLLNTQGQVFNKVKENVKLAKTVTRMFGITATANPLSIILTSITLAGAAAFPPLIVLPIVAGGIGMLGAGPFYFGRNVNERRRSQNILSKQQYNENKSHLQHLLSNILLAIKDLDPNERTDLLARLEDALKYESQEIKAGTNRSRADLHVIGRKIDMKNAQNLAEIIASIKTTKIIKINLTANKITNEGLIILMESLRNSDNLFDLHFNSNRLNEEQINLLINSLRDNLNINYVELNNINATNEQKELIKKIVRLSSYIRFQAYFMTPELIDRVTEIINTVKFEDKDAVNMSNSHNTLVPILTQLLMEGPYQYDDYLNVNGLEQDKVWCDEHLTKLVTKSVVEHFSSQGKSQLEAKEETLPLQYRIETQLECSRPMKFDSSKSRIRDKNKTVTLYFTDGEKFQMIRDKLAIQSKKIADVKTSKSNKSKESYTTHKVVVKKSDLKKFLEVMNIASKDDNPFQQLNKERKEHKLGKRNRKTQNSILRTAYDVRRDTAYKNYPNNTDNKEQETLLESDREKEEEKEKMTIDEALEAGSPDDISVAIRREIRRNVKQGKPQQVQVDNESQSSNNTSNRSESKEVKHKKTTRKQTSSTSVRTNMIKTKENNLFPDSNPKPTATTIRGKSRKLAPLINPPRPGRE